jgi:hypothetical protein
MVAGQDWAGHGFHKIEFVILYRECSLSDNAESPLFLGGRRAVYARQSDKGDLYP